MKLSIIIVNFNGKHFFDDCLTSITENVHFEHEVIVVDNASSDGSAEYLRSNFSNIRLVESGCNLGFSGGNNLGASFAQGRYLLLLNNDTILIDELSPAVDHMERDPSIGILGARMLGKDREYRYSAGYFPEPWRLLKFSWLNKKQGCFRDGVFPRNGVDYSVDWVEGSFLLTPLALWRQLGGLDESYFMYVEDVDYARRVVSIGKRVVYFPTVSYAHFGGSNQTRVGLIANGFRKYHKRHSGFLKMSFAYFLLDIGLVVRGVLYLAYSLINSSKFERALLYFRALKRANGNWR